MPLDKAKRRSVLRQRRGRQGTGIINAGMNKICELKPVAEQVFCCYRRIYLLAVVQQLQPVFQAKKQIYIVVAKKMVLIVCNQPFKPAHDDWIRTVTADE